MKKTYYLTKAIVSLPCMGLVPIGIWCLITAVSRADYMVGLFFTLLVAVYIGFIWTFCSPSVNPAFIKSAESPKVFVAVNAFITFVFTFLIFFAGACLWPLLQSVFLWLAGGLLDLEMSEQYEFVWLYFCAYTLFQFVYIRLWEYLRKYRWIRRLTLPHVCW